MHATNTTPKNHRARWAAIGAAVAVSLGAGGLGIARATAPDGASAYVPMVPCRLVDTRPGSNVGPRVGPLVGPDAELTVDGWSDVAGDCDLPAGTTGLQLNVTAIGASQLTNLRFYPEGADTPTASNLNPAPGKPPTPNAVAVSLNPANGRFHVFNRFGAVDVVIDVHGYFTDHAHDDRYYPRADADAAIDAAVAERVPRQQSLFIPASAFGPRRQDDDVVRTALLAYRLSGGYLDAPVLLPVGSQVHHITITATDSNPSQDLSLSLVRTLLGSSPAMATAAVTGTSGSSPTARTFSVAFAEPIEIEAEQTYTISAHASGWTNALIIYSVRFDYTLPAEPATFPPGGQPVLPPIVTPPPIAEP